MPLVQELKLAIETPGIQPESKVCFSLQSRCIFLKKIFEEISDTSHFTQVAAFEAICGKASMDGSVVNFLKAQRHMASPPSPQQGRSILFASGLGGEQACTPSFAHD